MRTARKQAILSVGGRAARKHEYVAPCTEGQPLWLPMGGHKGRPYNGHFQSRKQNLVIPAQAGIHCSLHGGLYMRKFVVTTAFFLLIPAMSPAQSAEPRYAGQGYFVFGFGAGTGDIYTHPLMWQVSGGGERFVYKGLGVGAEAGIVLWTGAPWPHNAVTASGDLSYHFGRHARRGKLDPFVLGGPSFVGPMEKGGGRGSPALNFGGGATLWLADHAGLRMEFRDIAGASYWEFDHYLSWRVGVTFR